MLTGSFACSCAVRNSEKGQGTPSSLVVVAVGLTEAHRSRDALDLAHRRFDHQRSGPRRLMSPACCFHPWSVQSGRPFGPHRTADLRRSRRHVHCRPLADVEHRCQTDDFGAGLDATKRVGASHLARLSADSQTLNQVCSDNTGRRHTSHRSLLHQRRLQVPMRSTRLCWKAAKGLGAMVTSKTVVPGNALNRDSRHQHTCKG
jgi:hypothetical protein